MTAAMAGDGVFGHLGGIPPGVRRFASFVTASFLLHALTVVSLPPSGVSGAPYRGPVQPVPLHATISPRDIGDSAKEPQPEDRVSAQPPEAAADAREGVPGGPDVPFPDKWFTAAEVDVRAEPLGQVDLEYPDELAGTGIRGRVYVLLYIDERGIVRNLRVTEADPPKLFDAAALRAWKDVRFSPAKKAGASVKSRKLLELAFAPS